MAERLTLDDLSAFGFATNDQLARVKAGETGEELPDRLTAVYGRNDREEHTVVVRDVHAIERSPVYAPLGTEGFERLARLLVDGTRIVTVGETADGEIFRLTEGPETPSVHEQVELRAETE